MIRCLPSDITAFILAGGRSSRMGTDKSLLRLGGLTLLDRAVATANAVCDAVLLVGDKNGLETYGPTVRDNYPGQGPLAGIEAALTSNFAKEWNLVLAVDTPAVSAELLKYLFSFTNDASAAVIVPRSGGHLQTLCAVYRRGFAEIAAQALREGRNKIDPLFSTVPVRIIDEDELNAVGFPPNIFDNVNSPTDWQRMQQQFGTDIK